MDILDKYRIEHVDGTPLKGKKYFVLRLDSDDPIEAARVFKAMKAYEGKVRNCDVGTAVEQSKRFAEYCCEKTSSDAVPACGKCPLFAAVGNCELEWGQLEYVKKEGKKHESGQEL